MTIKSTIRNIYLDVQDISTEAISTAKADTATVRYAWNKFAQSARAKVVQLQARSPFLAIDLAPSIIKLGIMLEFIPYEAVIGKFM